MGIKEDIYEKAKKVACPYANCGAGRGMECLVHSRGWDKNDPNRPAPKIRDTPHVVRVRKAGEEGHELPNKEEHQASVKRLEESLAH